MSTHFDLLVRPSDRTRLLQVVEGADPARHRRHVRVHACAPRRRVAPVRGPAHQPARRRARPGHRPQLPRHQRAQGVRGAARPPGLPRSRDRPRQPRALRRPRRSTRSRAPVREGRGRRDVHRPRRLQDDQRQPRPRRPATRCCARSRTGSAAPSARPTRWPGSAATSSPSCSTEVAGSQEAADVAERVLERARPRRSTSARSRSRRARASASA